MPGMHTRRNTSSAGSDEPRIVPNDATWLQTAFREYGTERFIDYRNNARVISYLKSTDLSPALANSDETDWCSAFVNWCVKKADLEGTNQATARSWEHGAKQSRTQSEDALWCSGARIAIAGRGTLVSTSMTMEEIFRYWEETKAIRSLSPPTQKTGSSAIAGQQDGPLSDNTVNHLCNEYGLDQRGWNAL